MGCIALRPAVHEDRDAASVCVMKRLYVKPGNQGRGIGRLLVQAAIQAAHEMGYREIILDTLDKLAAANRMYPRMGFTTCEAFYECPLQGITYWHMLL